ncbi:hypothetical protein GGF46_002066 [Coemansia sp. RSA 552]|nr:hypothetical protein GGF46_002066 [Coemansia sp. RSA 552]
MIKGRVSKGQALDNWLRFTGKVDPKGPAVVFKRIAKLESSLIKATEPGASPESLDKWKAEVLDEFGMNLRVIGKMGKMIYSGFKDKLLGLALLRVAAEEGHRYSGLLYAAHFLDNSATLDEHRRDCRGVVIDLAKRGHGDSQLALFLYFTRVLKRPNEAMYWLKQATDQKLSKAALLSGCMYRGDQRYGGLSEPNPEKAKEWFEKAIEYGAAKEGYFALGNMYSSGRASKYGKPDYDQALGLFEKAAALGHAESQYNVGVCYMEGKGTKKDAGLAVEYWTMAGAQRFPIALLNLGKILSEGREVRPDLKKARECLNTAIECSDKDGFVKGQAETLLRKIDQLGYGKPAQEQAGVQSPKDSWCPLDHFSNGEESLAQVYFVNRQHYKPGGPAILYSVGERRARSTDIDETTWVAELAQRTQGTVVLLEQRFYGDSVPDAAPEASVLQYLAVEQMMADIRRFIESGPMQGPWVLVGGSFAGSLMAWTKHRYPELDLAVVASSAPMRTTDAYWEFDQAAARRFPCAPSISSAVDAVDRVLDSRNATRIAQMKRAFGLDNIQDPNEFAAALTAQVSQVAMDPDPGAPSEFCQGFAGGHMRPLDDFAQLTRGFVQAQRQLFSGDGGCPAEADDRSWMWQQCTEIGLWQTAEAPPGKGQQHSRRLRSRRLSASYFRSLCVRCSPNGSLSAVAEIQKESFHKFSHDALRAFETGSSEATAGDVLFTTGELDPWRPLAAAAAWVIRGAVHAEDLLSEAPSPQVADARALIVRWVMHWADKRRSRQVESHTGAADSAKRPGRWRVLFVLAATTLLKAGGQVTGE